MALIIMELSARPQRPLPLWRRRKSTKQTVQRRQAHRTQPTRRTRIIPTQPTVR